MEKPLTTIVIAPSGAGKTTRVKYLKQANPDLIHLGRDEIIESLLSEHMAKYGSQLKPEDYKDILDEAVDLYHEQLAMEIKGKTPKLVIDYPPSGTYNGWALNAVSDSKQAGRAVHVEGIMVDPTLAFSRVRKKHQGVESPAHFQGWLSTYKNFPNQFLEIAEMADTAELLDNNAHSPKVIAHWNHGNCTILDAKAYEGFLELRNLQPQQARIEDYSARHPQGENPQTPDSYIKAPGTRIRIAGGIATKSK